MFGQLKENGDIRTCLRQEVGTTRIHIKGDHPAAVDLACTWGHTTDRMTGPEMIGLVEQLTALGRWLILTFHEIDGARLTVGGYEFNLLLDYLHRRREDIWTAPVAQVARKIADFRTAQPDRAQS